MKAVIALGLLERKHQGNVRVCLGLQEMACVCGEIAWDCEGGNMDMWGGQKVGDYGRERMSLMG